MREGAESDGEDKIVPLDEADKEEGQTDTRMEDSIINPLAQLNNTNLHDDSQDHQQQSDHDIDAFQNYSGPSGAKMISEKIEEDELPDTVRLDETNTDQNNFGKIEWEGCISSMERIGDMRLEKVWVRTDSSQFTFLQN